MEIESLKQFDKRETIPVNYMGKQEILKFIYWVDSAGQQTAWQSKNLFAYATLNFEGNRGIPLEIFTGEDFLDSLGTAQYKGELESFDEYVSMCRMMIHGILSKKNFEITVNMNTPANIVIYCQKCKGQTVQHIARLGTPNIWECTVCQTKREY